MTDLLRWFFIGVGCGMVSLFSAAVAHSAPLGGHDPLGLQHPRFPVDEFARYASAQEGFLGGNLDWTFGTRLEPVEEVLKAAASGSRWRVHIFNGPGLRNGQLGRYEPHSGHTVSSFDRLWRRGGGNLANHLRDRVRLYCELFARYPLWSLEISPTLEHNLSSAAFRRQAGVVRQACPSATVVDNPVGGVRSTPGFRVERHGFKVRGLRAPCNVSLDGDSATDVNVRAWLRRNRRCQRFVWDRVYNGRLPEGFIDPRERKAWPTADQLRELFTYTDPALPPAPAVEGCFAVERPRLWKPWADDKGTGDVRAKKPLWLSPARSESVLVLTAVGGREVATLKYFGPFDGGGFRYYSGTGSNLTPAAMADRAVLLSGSPYVVVQDGRQCFGPLHPAFRAGFFR